MIGILVGGKEFEDVFFGGWFVLDFEAGVAKSYYLFDLLLEQKWAYYFKFSVERKCMQIKIFLLKLQPRCLLFFPSTLSLNSLLTTGLLEFH